MSDKFIASALNQSTIAQSNQQALVAVAAQVNTAEVSQLAVAANSDKNEICG